MITTRTQKGILRRLINLKNTHPQVSFLTTEKDKVKLDVPQFQRNADKDCRYFICQ